MPKTEEIYNIELEEKTKIALECRVILYNDEWHTFDEVILQIMKATNCSFEKARDCTYEVHFNGKAIIFSGEMIKCLKVTAVLDEIELNSQILT